MLLPSLYAGLILGSSPQAAPIEFRRTFVKGERAQYEVKSNLNAEQRQGELETWIPTDLDMNYRFNYEVTEMRSDGICVMRYDRPSVTEIEGETVDKPPQTKVVKLDWKLILTVSPVNEVLDMKEVPKPKPPAKAGGKGGGGMFRYIAEMGRPEQLQSFLNQFVGEIYRLALFVGSLDSAMDFAPPLPVLEVKPGDTWKKTVGYSPQKLKGKGEKLAVQRLDFTYTYKGIVDSNGKKVHRILGDLSVKTDLAEFIHQTFNVKSDVTNLKEIPMSMTSQVEYDLDLKTHQTLRAFARSEGGFRVVATFQPNRAVQEEKFKARTTLAITGLKRP